MNLPTSDDAFPLDLGYIARNQISNQELKKLINARTDKQGKGPALGEKRSEASNLRHMMEKVLFLTQFEEI